VPEGYAPGTLYAAREALGVEESTLERRKWWSLPKVPQAEANAEGKDAAE
jgi:hypothetical protein